MAVTRDQVRQAYKKNFEALKDSAAAWNRTLDGFVPSAVTDAEMDLRRQVADFLHDISKEVELELGDPFQVAIHEAVRFLRRDRVTDAEKSAWRDVVKQAKEELKKQPTKDIRHPPAGPKDWKPGMKRQAMVEKKRRTLDDILEQFEGPYLYIMFNDEGGLSGWTIESPQYFQGHSGPVASVPVSGRMTYGDIEREIADTLGQADIDWELR